MPRKPKEPAILDTLPPRKRAFVKNYADPSSPTFGNATRSMVKAGAPDTQAAQVTASRALSNDKVAQSVREVLESAGVTQESVAGHWRRWMADSDSPWKRSPAVRTSELAARALGMLQETTINVDARSILLPSASSLSLTELEAQLAALEQQGRAEAEGSDKLSG